MPATVQTAIAVIGIEIGKNTFHIVGLDGLGVIRSPLRASILPDYIRVIKGGPALSRGLAHVRSFLKPDD